ncbi:MAG TPA: choice-of-anchor B family protein, partial [Bacteroidetes bacterium]|nr:choice-of-anchor B family protein [Bacteroidota bacterium]
MKAIISGTVFLFFYLANGHAQIQANMLGNWQDDGLVVGSSFDSRYNDVWGYANNGREYAIIGSTEAIHIIDVTDPSDLAEVQRIEGADGGFFLVHRDMKVYQDYLYCVADEGSGSTLQIIDLSTLPDTAAEVYNSNEYVVTCHNIFIDSSQARLYIVGKGDKTTVLDISDPEMPAFLATYPQAGFPLPYVHDAYIENNIGYMNCAHDGLWVVDFTDPDAPIILGTMTDYEDAGYNHSGWLSEDGGHYFLCDENHGSQVKSVNVTDPSDLKVDALFSPGNWANEIPHNCAVKGNLLYLSYYYDGMQVYDVSNPLNPVRVAKYDTYPGTNVPWYAGNWGIYPFLPSGNILLSDMQSGLFVIEKLPETATVYLDLKKSFFSVCNGASISFEMTVGSGFSPDGVTLEIGNTDLQANITFSENPAMPGDIITVTIADITSNTDTPEEIVILADDGINNISEPVSVLVDNVPAPVAAINSPAENSTVAVDNIYFNWDETIGADAYKLEIATDALDFGNTVVFDAQTEAVFYTLDISLDAATQYFWRIVSTNECGTSTSSIWAFDTEGTNAAKELAGN